MEKLFSLPKQNDKSLVQKINRSKASVEDIKNSLADDENHWDSHLLFVEGDTIGFARTVFGPTTSDLMIFNRERNVIAKWRARSDRATDEGTTKDDVMHMHFIGRTTVKVEAKLPVFGDILKVFRGNRY